MNRGFSLIELMVSISIFVIVTTVVMVNYPRFSNKLSLDLLAEDVALSIRQAQILGSSVFGAKSGGASGAFGAYGVHFLAPNPTNPDYNYIVFSDPTRSKEYGVSTNDLQTFLINGKNKVKFLCKNFDDPAAPGMSGAQRIAACADPAGGKQLGLLDIVFVRPNLNAVFTDGDGVNSPTVNDQSVSNVGIVLETIAGDYDKTVVVWNTGQISVE